ncbi:hypothetical protein NXG27_09330 [Megasphaera paucivorans]|uniref:Uncharacterized protein n=1 Tax=Megasphaera paucivorans TaxID=349095 RepID=A0A1G9W119_9FIRM|nr:hypothetical protein [Megasphaera paucivorans]SDM78228.1 hypothetical protein SAMN05660299_01529 [Megasphaera paucivorans]
MSSYKNQGVFIVKTIYKVKAYHAGNKARADVDSVFDQFSHNYIHNYSVDNNLYLNNGNNKNIKYYLIRSINAVRTFFEFRKCKNKVLLMHYPPLFPAVLGDNISFLYKNNETVFLVHDVDSIRYGTDEKKDIDVLNLAKVVIIHNEMMAKKLVQLGMTVPYIVNIHLFDYLVESRIEEKKYKKAIVFAGNLGKSVFLRDWIALERNYDIDLYGMDFPAECTQFDKVHYKGQEPPDTLPLKIDGGLGLVWDGPQTDTCGGMLGNYMRYNNPHKFSLYIASGIPVIVWNDAAIASIVKQYKIGYCINDLREINQIMDQISEKEYHTLQLNEKNLQQKVIHGGFLKDAVVKALAYVRE